MLFCEVVLLDTIYVLRRAALVTQSVRRRNGIVLHFKALSKETYHTYMHDIGACQPFSNAE